MAEQQIGNLAQRAAPLTRITKDSEEFELLAVNATFDGTNAATAYLPCVEVVSDAGLVVARNVALESVAAGDSAEVTFAPFLGRAGSGSNTTTPLPPFASYITNVSTAVPNNTSTPVGFGNAIGIYSNRYDIFGIDLHAGVYGVGIHAPGFYLTEWTLTAVDRSGHRVPTPEIEQVFAEDASSLELLSGMFLGSLFSYGYHNPGGASGYGQWDVVWARTIGVASSTVAHPIVVTVEQHTGETLDAFAYVQVTQLDPANLV